jgi:sugar fermentation stimulation protein A
VALFVVQRTNCDRFDCAADLDPKFAAGLDRAAAAGVEVLVYGCDVGVDEIRIARPLPWARSASLS